MISVCHRNSVAPPKANATDRDHAHICIMMMHACYATHCTHARSCLDNVSTGMQMLNSKVNSTNAQVLLLCVQIPNHLMCCYSLIVKRPWIMAAIENRTFLLPSAGITESTHNKHVLCGKITCYTDHSLFRAGNHERILDAAHRTVQSAMSC